MNFRTIFGTIGLILLAIQVSAAVLYVNVSNSVPVTPFITWNTAATNIQDAVNVATDGDLILVSNGVYKAGGIIIYGSLSNRVAINKAITVQSVNGPKKTFIQGYPALGSGAMRGVYLTNNAVLSGFTVTNGATATTGDNLTLRSGGGIWSESTSAIISNCIVVNSTAALYGGGTISGTLMNCTLTNNSAGSRGGGAMAGVLTNCIITRNSAVFGGGACSNTLVGCTLTNNWATSSGGGAFSCGLINCFLFSNSATNGGGATYGALTGCMLTNNTAYNGGGACSNTLNFCTLSGNGATNNGGGAFAASLTNCTLTRNVATNGGGGASFGKLDGCLLTLNSAHFGGAVFSNAVFNCTLMNSNTAVLGGGAFGSTLTSCLLSNNVGNFGGGSSGSLLNRCSMVWNYSQGGSASYQDNLNNCQLSFNVSTPNGNGTAYRSILNNCTVVHNFSYNPTPPGGGTASCKLTNSIVYYNDFLDDNGSQMSHCCLLKELNLFGPACFTNAPLFLADGFHLQTNSPCVDAGDNSFAAGSVDFDGRPRIVNGTGDIGATEFQGAALEPFIVWLDQYGLPDDGSADYADSDGDGMNNWQEFVAGVNPTNAVSVLVLQSPAVTSTDATITWSSVTNVTYYVQRSHDLSQAGFTSIQSNLVGKADTTSFTDTTATNGNSFFYRVGVQ